MVWYFICLYIINRTLHSQLGLQNVNNKFHSVICCTLSWNIFQWSKRHIVSLLGHEISSIFKKKKIFKSFKESPCTCIKQPLYQAHYNKDHYMLLNYNYIKLITCSQSICWVKQSPLWTSSRPTNYLIHVDSLIEVKTSSFYHLHSLMPSLSVLLFRIIFYVKKYIPVVTNWMLSPNNICVT